MHLTSLAPLALFAAATFAAAGCDPAAEPSRFVEEGLLVEEVSLTDADNAELTVHLEIERLDVAEHSDLLLDWSALSQDMWGGAELLPGYASQVSLRYFPGLDLEALAAGLADDSLMQSDVAVEVECESAEQQCRLSEFTFEAGHVYDTIGAFEAGSGTWLLTVRGEGSAEDLAYLALRPSNSSFSEQAALTDTSSVARVEARWAEPVPVAADGAARLDWSALTLDAQGAPLALYRVDRLELALVPGEALADPEALLTALSEQALEHWSADVTGRTELALPELLDGTEDFPGFEVAGAEGDRWVLSLACSTCGEALPAFAALLAPTER